jgi:hypothetical protein
MNRTRPLVHFLVRPPFLRLAIFALALLNTGCIIVPIPHGEFACDPRPGLFARTDADFIRPAQTTRQQVLLTLGEPDFIWADERTFAYVWATSDLDILFAAGGPGGGAIGGIIPMRKKHRLLIRFDEAGVVREFLWMDQTVQEFLHQEGKP